MPTSRAHTSIRDLASTGATVEFEGGGFASSFLMDIVRAAVQAQGHVKLTNMNGFAQDTLMQLAREGKGHVTISLLPSSDKS